MGYVKREMAAVLCLFGMLLPAMGQEVGGTKGGDAWGGGTGIRAGGGGCLRR